MESPMESCLTIRTRTQESIQLSSVDMGSMRPSAAKMMRKMGNSTTLVGRTAILWTKRMGSTHLPEEN